MTMVNKYFQNWDENPSVFMDMTFAVSIQNILGRFALTDKGHSGQD